MERIEFKLPIKTKQKPVHLWQLLASRIIKELDVPKQEQGLIFKVCYENPEAYVEHAFLETKELATGKLRSHYFLKVVMKR